MRFKHKTAILFSLLLLGKFCYANKLPLKTVAKETPESLWNPADKDFASSNFKMQALDAGLIDGALDEIKSVPLLISIVVDYTTSSKTRDKINKAFSDFSFKAVSCPKIGLHKKV